MIFKRHFSLVRLVKPQTLVGNHVRILRGNQAVLI